MTPKSRFAALALICLTATSAFALLSQAEALSSLVPTPDYTVQYVNYSYDTPPTWRPDPYTGEPILEAPSQHINNRSIEILIVNSEFKPYVDRAGNNIELVYAVRFKGHYEAWGTGTLNDTAFKVTTANYTSGYTKISLTLNDIGFGGDSYGWVDFQVKAFVGYTNQQFGYGYVHHDLLLNQNTQLITKSESRWGTTQTVYVNSEGQAPTDSGYVTALFTCEAIAVIATATTVIVGIMAWHYRRQKMPPPPPYYY